MEIQRKREADTELLVRHVFRAYIDPKLQPPSVWLNIKKYQQSYGQMRSKHNSSSLFSMGPENDKAVASGLNLGSGTHATQAAQKPPTSGESQDKERGGTEARKKNNRLQKFVEKNKDNLLGGLQKETQGPLPEIKVRPESAKSKDEGAQ